MIEECMYSIRRGIEAYDNTWKPPGLLVFYLGLDDEAELDAKCVRAIFERLKAIRKMHFETLHTIVTVVAAEARVRRLLDDMSQSVQQSSQCEASRSHLTLPADNGPEDQQTEQLAQKEAIGILGRLYQYPRRPYSSEIPIAALRNLLAELAELRETYPLLVCKRITEIVIERLAW